MTREQKKELKLIQETLKEFPKLLAKKEKRARDRQRFIEKTFGDVANQIAASRRKKVHKP